jgi:hypothetical protein
MFFVLRWFGLLTSRVRLTPGLENNSVGIPSVFIDHDNTKGHTIFDGQKEAWHSPVFNCRRISP